MGLAPVEADRAEGVGVGEPFQHGGREAGAQPQVAYGIGSPPAPLDQFPHVLLPDAYDLPQAQPHRVRRADVFGHRGVAGVDSPPRPLRERGRG